MMGSAGISRTHHALWNHDLLCARMPPLWRRTWSATRGRWVATRATSRHADLRERRNLVVWATGDHVHELALDLRDTRIAEAVVHFLWITEQIVELTRARIALERQFMRPGAHRAQPE